MSNAEPGRWDPYVLHDGDHLREHWAERFAHGGRVALVQGVGFDPRMCLALRMLRELVPTNAVDIWTVRFAAPADATGRLMAEDNAVEFAALVDGGNVTELDVAVPGIEQTARRAAGVFTNLGSFGDVTDIVVDVNALPRSVFFPMVAKLLYLCDRTPAEAPNLHVVAGDAAWLDAAIRAAGIDEHAVWLYPFGGTFGVESDLHVPRVWMPVLGEGTDEQLDRISRLVNPEEVCPMLPFPSSDPRRGDRLFEEYQRVMFDQLRTDSGTVIYGSESNPFQVYRRLRSSTLRYLETLKPLGGCKTAYSALSSKLVAIGVLLVAYELRDQRLEIGVADIGSQGTELERPISIDEAAERTTLVGLTLSGDCYL